MSTWPPGQRQGVFSGTLPEHLIDEHAATRLARDLAVETQRGSEREPPDHDVEWSPVHEAFEVGDRVRLVDMKVAPEMNGLTGTVTKGVKGYKGHPGQVTIRSVPYRGHEK